MQNFRDYYNILGIAKTATPDEIKKAYRSLARQYHPDVNPGDKAAEDKFKLLGEAYGVLSDTDKRQQYEQYSQYWQKQRSKGWGKWPGKAAAKDADYSAFEDFDNFVEQLLKQHQTSDRPFARQSTKANKSRSNASTKTQSRQAQAENPEQTNRQGTSSAKQSAATAKRRYRSQPASPSRRDAEADLTVPLEKAYAGGRERVRLEDGRSLEVSMPPGMVTGQRIRLKGQGIDGGNLYLRIEVEPHSYFSLREGDIYCRLPLTPSEAALGGTILMPTLGGAVNMMIPPGVQTGQRLKLTGKGYPIAQGLFGDQIVTIEVAVPTILDDEEKALYQELLNIERFNPREGLPFS